MSTAEVASVASAGVAALSAIAASIAARASRQSVSRAHRPFVWPEVHIRRRTETGFTPLRVRLHNDGPGTAYDVSCSIGPRATPTPERLRRWHRRRVLLGYAIPPVRAMRPGEAVPPRDADDSTLFEIALTTPLDEPWWVAVRWTDAAGARWEFIEPQATDDLAWPPRRLRLRRRPLRRRWRPRAYW